MGNVGRTVSKSLCFVKAIDEFGNIAFMEYNDIPSADGNLDEIKPTQQNKSQKRL
jgi:hypothetical protein